MNRALHRAAVAAIVCFASATSAAPAATSRAGCGVNAGAADTSDTDGTEIVPFCAANARWTDTRCITSADRIISNVGVKIEIGLIPDRSVCKNLPRSKL